MAQKVSVLLVLVDLQENICIPLNVGKDLSRYKPLPFTNL